MSGYGRTNPYPRRYGGGKRAVTIAHEALLDAYAPGWDVDDDTAIAGEAFAEAQMISMIWACNNRLRNQGKPSKMLEALATWETATRARVRLSDTDRARRARIAAKLRGFADNKLATIEGAIEELVGSRFGGVYTTDEANAIVYWPGINPGPPGLEWSSNRAQLRVEVSASGLSASDFLDLESECVALLHELVPAWMTFVVTSADDWTLGASASTGESLGIGRLTS